MANNFTDKPPYLKRFSTILIPTLFLWLVTFDWITRIHVGIQIFLRIAYVLLGVLWLVQRWRKGLAIRFPKFGLVLLVYFAYSSLLILRSPLKFHAIETQLYVFLYSFAFMVFIGDAQNLSKIRGWLFGFFQLSFLFSIFNLLLVIAWWASWIDISGSFTQPPPFGFRLPGLFLMHPNVEAAFLNLIIPFLLVGILKSSQRRIQIGLGLILLLFVVVSFFASSRGAWLGLAAAVFVVLVLHYQERIRYLLAQIMASRQFKISTRTIAFITLGAISIISLGMLSFQQARFGGHGGRLDLWAIGWSIFTEAPIFGHGPGSFHVLSAVEAGIPPGFYLVHAHNLILQILSESGIIGLSLLSVCSILILQTLWNAWKASNEERKKELIAYAGALTGMASHQMVDFAFEAPIYTIGIFYILANIGRYELEERQVTIPSRIGNPFAFCLILVCALVSLFTFRGSATNLRGVEAANDGDWEHAQELFCKAQTENPSMTFYYFQCGLASAVLADLANDVNLLEKSRTAYELGLISDPYWPLHQASAAAVEWVAGDQEKGLKLMQEAQANAPKSALLALNLGWMFAQIEQVDESQDLLKLAYQLDPWLLRNSSQQWLPNIDPLSTDMLENVEASIPTSTFHAWKGWLLLDQGTFQTAEESFQIALDHNPLQVEAYAGLAKIAYLQKDSSKAEKYLRLANFTGRSSPILDEVMAEWAELNDQEELSLSYIQRGVKAIFWNSASAPYYESVYGHAYLPIDAVPQLIQPNLPPSLGRGFEQAIERYGVETENSLRELLPWYENQIGTKWIQ